MPEVIGRGVAPGEGGQDDRPSEAILEPWARIHLARLRQLHPECLALLPMRNADLLERRHRPHHADIPRCGLWILRRNCSWRTCALCGHVVRQSARCKAPTAHTSRGRPACGRCGGKAPRGVGPDHLTELGRRIRALRSAAGVLQMDLAHAMGAHRNWLIQFETGRILGGPRGKLMQKGVWSVPNRMWGRIDSGITYLERGLHGSCV